MKIGRRLLVALGVLVAALVGVQLYLGYDYGGEVDRLMAMARERELTGEVGRVSLSILDREIPTRLPLARLGANRELSNFRFDHSNLDGMRALIASTDRFVGLIKEYAATERQRFDEWSNADRVSVTCSLLVIGMRAYLAAIEGNFDGAEEFVRLMHQTSRRAIRTGVGYMPNVVAIKWSNLICHELAAKNAGDVNKLNRIIALIDDQPRIDHKGLLSQGLAHSLAYLDAVQKRTWETNPDSQMLYNFNTARRDMGKIRVDLLRTYIDGFDNWDTSRAEWSADNALILEGQSLRDEIVSSAAHELVQQKRHELDQVAADRAIRLTIAAYKARYKSPDQTSTEFLNLQGSNAIDPWTGKQFELEFERDRIYVKGLRGWRGVGDSRRVSKRVLTMDP